MKKLIVFALCAGTMFSTAAFAQKKKPNGKTKPATTEATKKVKGASIAIKGGDTHDFGSVEKGPIVYHTFEFTNTGSDPLVIADVNPSCGCTNVEWTPKEPIKPGKKGTIKVGLRTAEQHGVFQKEVYIRSNAANNGPDSRYTLHIKGTAIEGDKKAEKK